jgi:nucleoside-diphosphate-sugar epimerase
MNQSRPTLLLTGATGAVGQPLLAALRSANLCHRIHVLVRDPSDVSPDREKLTMHRGDLADPTWSVATLPRADIVLHAAASTRFRAPAAELDAINHLGTARLLAWAETLPHPPRFIHLSTCCVAGTRTGDIPELPLSAPSAFVNAYEKSKWLAEQRAHTSPLAPEIVRLSIVAGDESAGSLARPGAFQSALRWFRRGLLPLVPGDAASPVDLISTDLVSAFLLRLLSRRAEPGAIYQLSAGASALPLAELLDLAAGNCRAIDDRWRRGHIIPPVIADPATFADFRTSVARSGDLLFNEVLASADSFLPVLLHPKRFSTTAAERVWGAPLPTPSATVFATRVIAHALAS